MKNFFVLLLMFSFSCIGGFSQARLMMNGAYVLLNGGTSGTPINLVVDNSAANAITNLTPGTGWIISEGEFNRVRWNIGTSTGIYTVPFGYSTSNRLDLTTNLTTAGVGAGSVFFSTYRGSSWNNNLYMPTGVTHTNDLATGSGNNSAFAIDRFWVIDASGYTTRPTPTITFTYADPEWSAGGNTITEANLRAQRFNTTANLWGDWLGPLSTTNIIANTTSSGSVTPANFFRPWTLSDASSPLPIELVSFTGQCTGNIVTLNWSVASQTGNDYFNVEKTINGVNFETVAIVDGAGTTSQTISYSAVDYEPFSGSSYYRLKQTDLSSQFSYSGLVPVHGCDITVGDITNAWNNGSGFTISIFSLTEQYYEIKVCNTRGQKVLSGKTLVHAGYNEFTFPVKPSSGIYYVMLLNDAQVVTKKIMMY